MIWLDNKRGEALIRLAPFLFLNKIYISGMILTNIEDGRYEFAKVRLRDNEALNYLFVWWDDRQRICAQVVKNIKVDFRFNLLSGEVDLLRKMKNNEKVLYKVFGLEVGEGTYRDIQIEYLEENKSVIEEEPEIITVNTLSRLALMHEFLTNELNRGIGFINNGNER